MAEMHFFQELLTFSQRQSALPMWEQIYRRAFPTFGAMHAVKKDGWAQRGGIDRRIILEGGKVLSIDEKIRRRDYPDIALEDYSNWEHGTLGWIAKDLACDSLAYALLPSQRCSLLPLQSLRMVWEQQKEEWLARYPVIDARNDGYPTRRIFVPIPILLEALL